MRLTKILVLLFLVASSAIAQEETLVSGNIESGGFGGPVLKVGSFNGQTGLVVGGRGGWIINHSFIIGGGGYGLVNNVRANTFGPNGERYLDFGYGGLELEYVPDSPKLIHYSIMTLIGAGGVSWRDNEVHTGFNIESNTFFIVEPGINVTLNVTDFFRISGGVSYRIVSGTNSSAASDSDVSGPLGVITFHFGKF